MDLSALSPLTDAIEDLLKDALADGQEAFQSGDLKNARRALERAEKLQDALDHAHGLAGSLDGVEGVRRKARVEPEPVAVAKRRRDMPEAEEPDADEEAEEQPSEEPAEQEDPREKVEAKRRKSRLSRDYKDFTERSRGFLNRPSWDDASTEARVKALISAGRAVHSEAESLGDDTRAEAVEEEIRVLQNEWNRRYGNDVPFFGFNMMRSHPGDLWSEVEQGYLALAVSEESFPWFKESLEDLSQEDATRIFDLIAAGTSYLHRLFHERNMKAFDQQQKELYSLVSEFAREERLHTIWWKFEGPGVEPLDEMAKAAQSLTKEFPSIKSSVEKRLGKERAISAIESLMGDEEPGSDFEDKLAELTISALDAGVPASSKQLRGWLGGMGHIFGETSHPKVSKLLANIEKDTQKLIEEEAAEQESDADKSELDPITQERMDAVKKLVKGKTIYFVGGRKGQTWRRDRYVEELGLKDLIWPDAEETKNVNELLPNAEKADIVCQLIRFSRHSYKLVLDHAKELGKQTVMIRSGLGLNQVINELYSQLIDVKS